MFSHVSKKFLFILIFLHSKKKSKKIWKMKKKIFLDTPVIFYKSQVLSKYFNKKSTFALEIDTTNNNMILPRHDNAQKQIKLYYIKQQDKSKHTDVLFLPKHNFLCEYQYIVTFTRVSLLYTNFYFIFFSGFISWLFSNSYSTKIEYPLCVYANNNVSMLLS